MGTRQGRGAVLAALGIVLGIASIVTDLFYFSIFPARPVVL